VIQLWNLSDRLWRSDYKYSSLSWAWWIVSPSDQLDRDQITMFKLLPIALLATLAVADPTVYLIRHGEKPDDGNGLSTQGLERAQCLRSVFGANSSYDIGHIMAETPKSSEFSFLLLSRRIGCFVEDLQNKW
jgi:hypothetical protein